MADLLATSWTVHRAAPLYHGKECKTLLGNSAALRLYASRLRDTLTGDVLRGVQLSGTTPSALLDEALMKAGALKACKWDPLPTWSHWNEEQSLLEDPDDETPMITPDQSAGIIIVLEYENITYKAALLAGPDGYHDTREEVTHLPLLVTRMPNPLRQEFISFLSANFDTRVSLLRLPGSFLCAALEAYLATLNRAATSRGNGRDTIRDFIERTIKETQLTVTFPQPISPSLRSLDVSIPRASLAAFYARGKTTTNQETPSTPFLTALSDYFRLHLAMPLDVNALKPNPDSGKSLESQSHMRLSKVSCGAFVLGGEGRVKFLANPGRSMFLGEDDENIEDEDEEDREKRLVWRANENLLRALVRRAVGHTT